MVAGIVAIFMSAGLYIWWSTASWDNYERQYHSVSESVDSRLEAVFSLQSDTGEEKQVKLAMLSTLRDDLTTKFDLLCLPQALVAWQKVFKAYAEREQACSKTKVALGTFRDALGEAVAYLQDERALAKHLSAAPVQGEVSETEFETQLTAWRRVFDAVKDANSGGRSEAVKQVAVGVTAGVVKSWEEVIASHQAKNKERYIKATQDLAASFDKLNEITTKDVEQMSFIADRLKEAHTNMK